MKKIHLAPTAVMAAAVLWLGGAAAHAQGPPPPDGGPGPGGFGGFGGPDGGPGRMQPRTLSAASVPLRVLAQYLGLSDAQVGKIALARESMADAFRPPAPPQGGQPGGQPPRREDMQARRQAAEKTVQTKIAAVLTDAQRGRLATLVKAMQALQAAQIRPDAALKLNLSAAQITQLAAIGGNAGAAPTRVPALLTPAQRTRLQSFRQPMPGGGGGPPRF